MEQELQALRSGQAGEAGELGNWRLKTRVAAECDRAACCVSESHALHACCSFLCVRVGTHPGYLRALDLLDGAQADHVLAIDRLREERLRDVEVMYHTEMQALHDQYTVSATSICSRIGIRGRRAAAC